MFNIGKPSHSRHTDKPFTIVVRIIVAERFVHLHRRLEIACASDKWIVKPNSILLNQRENFLIGDGVSISDYCELLFCLKYPRQKLAKKGERRISHNYVRLITKLFHLFASEVSVTVKILPFDIFEVYSPITCRIVIENEYLSPLIQRELSARCIITEEIAVLGRLRLWRIACRYQLLQSKRREVFRKISGEIAPLRVVTRQKNRLIPEHVSIELKVCVHLGLYVGILRVELVLLRLFRLQKGS